MFFHIGNINGQTEKYEKKYSKININSRITAKNEVDNWLKKYGQTIGVPTTLRRGKLYYSPTEVTFYSLDSMLRLEPDASKKEINEILRKTERNKMYMSDCDLINTKTDSPQNIYFMFDAKGNLLGVDLVEYYGSKTKTVSYKSTGELYDPYGK
ncbi:hypothetical protein BH10BAC1_BH10BAC1_16910 [soil metagenome]